MATRVEQKAATRRRVLAAASEIFFREGYAAAGLREIAMEAGIAPATLYKHVRNKAELYVEVLLECGGAFGDQIQAVLDGGGPARDQLGALAELQFGFWSRHPDYVPIFWVLDNQDLVGRLPRSQVKRVVSLWKLPLRALETVLQRGMDRGEFAQGDAWTLANVLWNAGNLAFELKHSPERRRVLDRPLEEFYRSALALTTRGLTAAPQAGLDP
ncbi:MAG: TetR/AcrR family transcriptional regulator [Proteobacteria bacterium]|nr:TetR/AcrR family transcriptional regulator [Pseudomonadota bacterium]